MFADLFLCIGTHGREYSDAGGELKTDGSSI